MSTTTRRATLVAATFLVGITLNGCGVADTEIRPGVAADVDGSVVRTSDVDDLVSGTCAYLEAGEGTQAYPRVTVRRLFFETLVRQEAAERVLDEVGATLPDDYTGAVADVDKNYTDIPDDQAAAMRQGDKALIYVALAADGIGNTLLREETGKEPADGTAIRARGDAAIDEWIASHDVALNPTYGLRLDGGSFIADDGLSVPVSVEALGAAGAADIDLGVTDEQEQQAAQAAITQAVSTLPDDQVCGTPAAPGAGAPAAG